MYLWGSMRKLPLLFAAFLLSVPVAVGGGPLSLETCREAARKAGHLEQLGQYVAADREAGARLGDHDFLFSISAYAVASYQNDSPNLNSLVEVADRADVAYTFHSSPKFQYHTGFLLTQPLYSGGQRRIRADLNEVEHDIRLSRLNQREMELDATVDDLYLGILLSRKQEEILERQLNTVRLKLGDIQDAYEAGLGYRDAVLLLEAQVLKLEAEMAGNRERQRAGIAMLAALTDLPIEPDTELEMPEGEDLAVLPDPGIRMLDLEERKFRLEQQLARAKARPSLKAWGTIGYGQWPMNFFQRSADAYGIVGLSLRVPITDWRAVRHTGDRLDAALGQLTLERDVLERERRVELLKYDGEIARLESLRAASERTAEKYEELCRERDTLVAQGASSLSDYLTALEQLSEARLYSEIYALQKLRQQLLRKRYSSSRQ